MPPLLPFKLNIEEEIPKFRAETFWTKEPETIHWINSNLSESTVIGLLIDVGANIGIYSLYSAAVNDSIPVFAVEPVTATFIELNANIKLNLKTNQIFTFEAALSSVSDAGILTNVDPRLGSSGAQIEINVLGINASTLVLSGDQLLQTEQEKYDHTKKVMIKIDTDGNELDVLNGFTGSFESGLVATVLVETHPRNRDGIEAFFRELNFREDESYLKVEGHSNSRRKAKGNGERTKVYVCPMV